MNLTIIDDNSAELILTSKKTNKQYTFLITKFNLEDALEIALAVHRDVLSLLPAHINDVVHFESLNVFAFKDTMKKTFIQTFLQPQAISCSDLNKVKLPLDLLMPLFMEVIKYNDFFILLGIESMIETTLDFLQVSIEKLQLQMKSQTIMIQEQVIEFEETMNEIEKEEQELVEAQKDLQSLTTSNE